eukprot:3940883-Rhodomonas_salina.1
MPDLSTTRSTIHCTASVPYYVPPDPTSVRTLYHHALPQYNAQYHTLHCLSTIPCTASVPYYVLPQYR